MTIQPLEHEHAGAAISFNLRLILHGHPTPYSTSSKHPPFAPKDGVSPQEPVEPRPSCPSFYQQIKVLLSSAVPPFSHHSTPLLCQDSLTQTASSLAEPIGVAWMTYARACECYLPETPFLPPLPRSTRRSSRMETRTRPDRSRCQPRHSRNRSTPSFSLPFRVACLATVPR